MEDCESIRLLAGAAVNSSTAHVGKGGPARRTSRLTSRARLLDATWTSISEHASVGDRSEPGRTSERFGQVYGRRGPRPYARRARDIIGKHFSRSRRSSPVVVFQVRVTQCQRLVSRVNCENERLPNGRLVR